MSQVATKVEHNAKKLAFIIRMMDKSICQLEYKQHPNAVMEMYHTEVPKQHEGKGLAKQLVKEAFKYAIDNHYKVLPTCSYVARYAKQMASEEEKKIVVQSLMQ